MEKVVNEELFLEPEKEKCMENLGTCVDVEMEKLKNIDGLSEKLRAAIATGVRQQCEEAFHQCLENAPAAAVKAMMAKRNKKINKNI